MNPVYIKHKVTNIISITKIITMHFLELDKNFDIYSEKHDFWEMIYIETGEADVILKNETISLKKGDVFFVKPNLRHKLCGNKKVNFNAFIISFSTNSSSMKFFSKKCLNVNVGLREYISLIINEGRNAFIIEKNTPYKTVLMPNENSPLGSLQMIRCYMEQFLIMLLRGNENKFPNLFSNKENMENHIVLSVKNILTYNIYSNISVDEICESLHYSRTYISKVFKKYCNTTMNSYYNELKINEAKILIDSNKYNFTQIAEKLGYSNSHYFTRVFKRVTGITPTEYAEKL